jgi:hypothetical protein
MNDEGDLFFEFLFFVLFYPAPAPTPVISLVALSLTTFPADSITGIDSAFFKVRPVVWTAPLSNSGGAVDFDAKKALILSHP